MTLISRSPVGVTAVVTSCGVMRSGQHDGPRFRGGPDRGHPGTLHGTRAPPWEGLRLGEGKGKRQTPRLRRALAGRCPGGRLGVGSRRWQSLRPGPDRAGHDCGRPRCGAGLDLCIAAALVGKRGRAVGIDLTPAMASKAEEAARLMGLSVAARNDVCSDARFSVSFDADCLRQTGVSGARLLRHSARSVRRTQDRASRNAGDPDVGRPAASRRRR